MNKKKYLKKGILLYLLFSVTAFSEEVDSRKIYKGDSHWTKPYISGDLGTWRGFSTSDKEVVRRSAEDDALGNCYEEGHRDCMIKKSYINHCNYKTGSLTNSKWNCHGKAIAIGFN